MAHSERLRSLQIDERADILTRAGAGEFVGVKEVKRLLHRAPLDPELVELRHLQKAASYETQINRITVKLSPRLAFRLARNRNYDPLTPRKRKELKHQRAHLNSLLNKLPTT